MSSACITDEESAVLKTEWAALARENKVNGMCVFQKLFQQNPEYIKLFQCTGKIRPLRLDKATTNGWDTLGSAVKLLCHTQSVMKSVGSAVGLCHDPEAFDRYLRRIGGEHVCRHVAGEQYKSIFPIIIDQLILCNAGRLSRSVWQKFFALCTQILVEGSKTPVEGGAVPTVPALRAIFQDWDADHDGALSISELQSVMSNLQVLSIEPAVDSGRVNEMVVKADKNKDGLIQFNEFLDVMRPNKI